MYTTCFGTMFIDWLAVTFTGPQSQVLLDLRDMFDDFKPLSYGGNGYTHSAGVWETGRVFWHPERPEMGVNVRLPSSALAHYVGDAVDLIVKWCKGGGAYCTRIDIASDDMDYHLLDMSVVEQKILDLEYLCLGHNVSQTRVLRGGFGNTIYFGSRLSDVMVRIYDKTAERIANGDVLVPFHWIRVEMELKGERARRAGRFIANHPEDWGIYAAGWLYDYLDFKEPDPDDGNISRWQTCEWWSEFLDRAGKCKLLGERKVTTLNDVLVWIDRQVSPSLFVVASTVGYDELLKIIGNGSARLNDRQVRMIREYRSNGDDKEGNV